ncbi:MAG: DUF4215 domain-containing protein [Candidatus Peribacteria bacterium]|nr:MAG: DUF4215 domain-containing protein [Candidatus Peribacteria bacterium]
MTFTVKTAPNVGSALLIFGNGQPIPTQKVKDGEFVKNMSFGDPQTLPIDVRLLVNGNASTFEDVDTITITQDIKKILTAAYTAAPNTAKADLTWTYTGAIDYFKIMYGTERNVLTLSLTTSNPQGSIILADPKLTYYAQIFPVDENGIVNGEPSEILQIDPLVASPVCGNGVLEAGETCEDGNTINGDGCDYMCQFEVIRPELPVCGNGKIEAAEECDDGNALNNDGCSNICRVEQLAPPVAPSCFTDNIRIEVEQVNDRYFLTWAPVANTKEYIIYRSDTKAGSTNAMTEVARTTTTRFEYPFDPYAEVDRWAWYAVQAVCNNGDLKQVGDMKQVKVGPEDTLLVVLALALLSVVGIRLWRLV